MVGWSDGAGYTVQCRGVLLIWVIVGQGPTALAVDAIYFFFTFFSHLSFLFSDGPI